MERTHDDTWDLATSVGATATMVAAGRARATTDSTSNSATWATQGRAGTRRDVADYLDARGWRSVRTPLRELFATTGLSQPPRADGAISLGDNYYCTSVRI
jgi:O-methyltransferase involved in polyketide biosynthesis